MSRRNHETTNPNLVIGGTHGPPETIGLELCDSLQKDPIGEWDHEIGNIEAVKQGRRFIDRNLALAYNEANHDSPVYEERRAAQLLDLVEGREVVLDIHDLPGDQKNEFVAIGAKADPRLLSIAAFLGIENAVVFHTAQTRLPEKSDRTLLIELGRGHNNNELVAPNVIRLRECMGKIAANQLPLAIATGSFNYFERAVEVTTAEAKALALPSDRIEPFDTIPPEILRALQKPERDLPPGDYVADYWTGEVQVPIGLGVFLDA